MNRVDRAMAGFTRGRNCAQSVLEGFPEKASGEGGDLAIRMAAAFGGGMGRLGEVCGALTGAFMVLGLHGDGSPGGKERLYAQVRELAAAFTARHGSLLCRELTGCDLTTEEGRRLAAEKNIHATVCSDLVRSAVELLEESLGPSAGR